VIGAAGFIGRRLCRQLVADGWDVFAPAKHDPGLFHRELGCVIYCAGLTADFDARPYDAIEAHATLVSELARAGNFERLIYLSSTRLYDGLKTGREEALLQLNPTSPRHTYDLSKALGENVALTRTGGRGAVARIANVYDWEADAPGFLSQWLIRAREDRDLQLATSPHVQRDYIHLDDVVAALVAMAAAEVPSVINLASGELVSNREIAEVFAAAGRQVDFLSGAPSAPPPSANVARLKSLGVRPRPVREVVWAYLQELGACS
jgi:nucleoside-diphosphate-sugar epimerase